MFLNGLPLARALLLLGGHRAWTRGTPGGSVPSTGTRDGDKGVEATAGGRGEGGGFPARAAETAPGAA